MRGHMGLYVANSNRGNMTRSEDIFVLSTADDCKTKWSKGQHLLVSDAFELEPVDLDLWEKYENDPAFAKLKKFNDEVQGKIVTTIVHETSILAEVEGDLFQEDTRW